MIRGFLIAISLLTLAGSAAPAGEMDCARSATIDLGLLLKQPSAHLGECVRLHGTVRVAGKLGVTLSPAADWRTEDQPAYIGLYFSQETPPNLESYVGPFEVSGRVMTCNGIWENARVSAERDNRAEATRKRAPNKPEVVHLGMVFGHCHYNSDAYAVLVSRYRKLQDPPH